MDTGQGRAALGPKGLTLGFPQSSALVQWPWAHPAPASGAERAAEPPKSPK